ncbi:sugar diacid utilization regulator [Nocardioides ginsengisegetis]|uniref:Sugar diacid utilization regulator n=1 Tax=Nocardioides ginsengisegetis TaxID=661491 RepID=A0A7W3J284_9ACTN|nr:helix-turn-helix domain-containing protein [Nocardioides ginsengisegetis]MBA8804877.1 sugar diacid utilization regulator [Nocardioides ginsengisegetis]
MNKIEPNHPERHGALSSDGRRLVDRLARRKLELAQAIVADVQREVMDYGSLGALTMSDDVLATALLTITDLVDSLLAPASAPTDHAEVIRRSASRRVHQDVSLPSLLHSYRIWGARVWQTVLEEAADDPVLRTAALELATRIFDYVDLVSVTLAQVYLEEAAGAYRARDVLRSDILESLLLGRALSDGARVEIARLNLSSDDQICVIVVRLSDVPPDKMRSESLTALRACREILAAHNTILLGVRDSDVVCLVRVANPLDVDHVVAGAHQLATRGSHWRVCVGRPHQGLDGIPRSFHEAQEAAAVAASQRRRSRAVLFSDVILDRILVHSEYAQDLLQETVRPLMAYDDKHSADLLITLRAYVLHDFNMTRTAKELHVNPNTVAYRIKRISQLTSQDATTAQGIVTLALALRLLDG